LFSNYFCGEHIVFRDEPMFFRDERNFLFSVGFRNLEIWKILLKKKQKKPTKMDFFSRRNSHLKHLQAILTMMLFNQYSNIAHRVG